ncbi:MAG TPA: hypothetical protein VFU43_02290 [Streptosporangiaceae bacterium]|nr:hypothetical protein [Streptosporangiaceae bacterium]
MAISAECGDRGQLSATAAELQTMADLIRKYPAEAQLIMGALEDGLTLGPMRIAADAMPESGASE